MNCYEFEINISAYIEGEIKQSVRKRFLDHRDNCINCQEKIQDISAMLSSVSNIEEVTSSPQFFQNLQNKIDAHNNRDSSIINRILNIQPFGMKPFPALGFTAAIALLIVSSAMIINQDRLPSVDFEKLSERSKQTKQVPSQTIPQNSHLYAAGIDSTKDDSVDTPDRNIKDQIKLVNQKKP